MAKRRLPTEKDIVSNLNVIDKFNEGTFGKGASRKNASIFQATNLKGSVDKPFGTKISKRLKKSKELL